MNTVSYGVTPIISNAQMVGACLYGEYHLPNAEVGVGQDFLADRIWLAVRSRKGRYVTRCAVFVDRSHLEAGKQLDVVRVIGEAIREASYSHAAYWESQVWC